MKALTYQTFGPPDVLAWADHAEAPPPGPGEVTVRVIAGGLNPKDALLRKGNFSRTLARAPLPRVSGLDLAGEVVEVGAGVTHYQPGDRVYGMTNAFSGGMHAQRVTIGVDQIAPAPTSLSITDAAAIPLAAQTALQALRDSCALRPAQRVLIIGASGGVGHFAVQIAKQLRADVHAVCSARNLDFVCGLGADAAHDYAQAPAHTITLPNNARFDAVFDVFGRGTHAVHAHQLAADGVYVSTVPKAATIAGELLGRLHLRRRSRLVVVRSRAQDLGQLAAWADAGALKPFVEQVFPVQQAADAHARIESKRTRGKLVLQID